MLWRSVNILTPRFPKWLSRDNLSGVYQPALSPCLVTGKCQIFLQIAAAIPAIVTSNELTAQPQVMTFELLILTKILYIFPAQRCNVMLLFAGSDKNQPR